MTPNDLSKKGYHKLLVWQEAHKLVLAIYRVTEDFPRTEVFGLTSQMRRAALSVAANITEGQARRGSKEFVHFLSIANGSLVELEYHLEVARDLGFLSPEKYAEIEDIRTRAGYLLHGLIRSKVALGETLTP